ncbi:MAG: hypothetical protein ACXVRS_11175 [Gaiellaceae bacterium]
MISLFTVPKAFEGRSDWIQRNAIGSWTKLGNGVQVLLVGDDPGVAEAAAELGVEHVPELTRSEHGTPLLDGVFASARRLARNPLLCFVNADIVLLDDFARGGERLLAENVPFLAVGDSRDTAIDQPLAFEGDWEADLRRLALRSPRRGAGALDWFLYTRDLYEELPPFAVGRIGFDNWLVWRAWASGARVVDATPSVLAIHQRHDYSHVSGGREATRSTSGEGRRNLELAGDKSHLYTRYDATHILGRRRLRRNVFRAFRLKENLRKAVYKVRTHTPWPPADWSASTRVR